MEKQLFPYEVSNPIEFNSYESRDDYEYNDEDG